ncbi:PREDICTED: uncharacterized protein LOC109210861 isoform X2 [Nicotiana attenuata]|uniref:uncharacterized protein LOC109210861 isoform X2 n=1 Tax=Nicotiana attenuata TaxID=49451 RepID=UPI000905AA1A|nr:PREDICTED: uncharacterized protein LOC109210861 isoform X2 [Nicotiana attenuata]
MAKSVCDLLKREELKAGDFLVEDVHYIPAQVKIVKCFVQHISVDISFNQVAGLCSLSFLEQVNHYIGRGHLFKHSIILIKAWCYYESRILGAQSGLISTYALEILVLHIINRFHSSVDGPLAVLYRFLDYYHTFDWENYGISIYGPVAIKCLQDIVETPTSYGNEMLLSKELLDCCLKCSMDQMRVDKCKGQVFLLKYLNVVDPLKQCNNLGRCVTRGNFYRIRYALSHGFQTLRKILTLPEEKVCGGLKKFFVNTLELNSDGRRSDVDVRAMLSCARSEVLSLNGEYNSHINYLRHYQCSQKLGLNVPLHSSSQISSSQFQGNMQKTSYGGNFQYPGTIRCISTSPCYPNSPHLFGSAFSANEPSAFRGMELYNPFGSTVMDSRQRGRGISLPSFNGELDLQRMYHCFPKFVIEENLPNVCRDSHDMHIKKDMSEQSGIHGIEIDTKEKVKLQGEGIRHSEIGETSDCITGTGLKEKSQETEICIFNSNVDETAAAQGINTSSDAKSSDMYIYVPQMTTKGGTKSEGTLLKSDLDTGRLYIFSEAGNDQGHSNFDLSQEDFPGLPSCKKMGESQQFVQPVAESQRSWKPSPCKENEYGTFGTQPIVASRLHSFEPMKQLTDDETPTQPMVALRLQLFEPMKQLSEDVISKEPDLGVATFTTQATLNASPLDEEMVMMQQYCLDDNKDFPPLCHCLKKSYPEQ